MQTMVTPQFSLCEERRADERNRSPLFFHKLFTRASPATKRFSKFDSRRRGYPFTGFTNLSGNFS